MLLSLRDNSTKKKTFKFLGGKTKYIPFDPLTLPNYQAGYLMNQTTDVPSGSIDPAAASGNWFDAIVLSAASHLLQSASASELTVVNGFNCFQLNATDTRLSNNAFDVFTTFDDFTILIGFKKSAAIANYDMLFAQNNTLETERCYIAYTPAGKIEAQLANLLGTNAITCLSTNTYDDQLPHCMVVTFDQTNKTVRLITHTGEDISNNNAGYGLASLQGNSSADFRIGDWGFAPPFSAQPGCFGDIIILNDVAISDALINQLMAWECSRLGIAHVPI